jgi:hypothetical protein
MKGTDGGSAEAAIADGLADLGKQVTGDAMSIWHTATADRIMEAAGGRATIDAQRDQRGSLQSRENNDLHKLENAMTAPVWNDAEGAWQFAIAHPQASLHEWGAMPHEIKAKEAEALAFEWPDAPQEIEERFQDSWPLVFFDSVEHPGTPAIGMMRHGRETARRRLEKAGYETEEYIEGGGYDG